ncbi:MAG: helix-turn-helix domain-containing protein [Ferruginibacter sp.]|nr:helix-turn-helix domain-containing protein [Ferruginibacter sp.]
MNFIAYTQKLQIIEEYITKQWAVTPDQLAQKLNVSRRTVLRMIMHLKEQGSIIEYCKSEKRYKIISK